MSATIRKAINGYVVVMNDAHHRIQGGLASRQLGGYSDGQERIYSSLDEAFEFMRSCFEPKVAGYAGLGNALAQNVKSPEQPSYKHPEKDIFNLSEDEAKPEPDFRMSDGRGVYMGSGKMVDCSEAEDSTETMIESDPIIVSGSAPLGADFAKVYDDNAATLYEDGPFNGLAPNGQAQE